YWGIRSDIRSYNVANVLACPLDRTSVLAATPTRLKRLDDEGQEQLINWGYAICDAALRAHCRSDVTEAIRLSISGREGPAGQSSVSGAVSLAGPCLTSDRSVVTTGAPADKRRSTSILPALVRRSERKAR